MVTTTKWRDSSRVKITAPQDGSEVWGAFKVRLEVHNFFSSVVDPRELNAQSVEVFLDGDLFKALAIPLGNRTRQFHILTIPPLPAGQHVLEAQSQLAEDLAAYHVAGRKDQVLKKGSCLMEKSNALLERERGLKTALWCTRDASVLGCELLPALTGTTDKSDGQPWSKQERWNASETAILVIDMWAFHGCESLSDPTDFWSMEIARDINRAIMAARDLGVFIVHVPSSGVEEMWAEYPEQRERMVPTASIPSILLRLTPGCLGQSVEPLDDEPTLPIQGGGCDDGKTEAPTRWDDESHYQNRDIKIFPLDGLSDSANEIVGTFKRLGMKNVVVTGVHLNECILKRPFGIRQLLREGFNVVVARDLTDSLYDSRDPPYISHRAANHLMVKHVETYICCTISSHDFHQLNE
ncbi:hypothetical protein GUITHDRAFT_145342 [Guillardia theta CCMP2712]|uniref:Uncharacterized protein n=1 Tax=Guillardia theta (strain CCMP2712) TaxID=905079 RepID=L1IL68_GUITC|nr:hypothetical protein GUITHDRAFT_145342 [Guillardia theta CCMP2712]EKX36986.1 hypothetical protein GUITHDRAFT_145342 [Guillardia theta CCMP2712]|eukprot:XP_005823966.1 hypothetical protein GUITHDRAFT_145342 [Guillardia theta CCMP2712]